VNAVDIIVVAVVIVVNIITIIVVFIIGIAVIVIAVISVVVVNIIIVIIIVIVIIVVVVIIASPDVTSHNNSIVLIVISPRAPAMLEKAVRNAHESNISAAARSMSGTSGRFSARNRRMSGNRARVRSITTMPSSSSG
jgi:hypothetical protein